MAGDLDPEVSARARAWRTAALNAVCDLVEPWEHGTVFRATRYPTYFDFNLVRVEDDPGMTVDQLAALADDALDGLIHRRFDFDDVAAADARRAGFERLGWSSLRLLWMRHEQPAPPAARDLPVEEVAYDAVHDLRVTWFVEDHPDQIAGSYHAHAREVALRRGAQVLAVRRHGRPIAFAQLERAGDGAEITQVYVHPDHRGAGIGTAMTRTAIEAAGDARDLWIAADDEGRPKELYARLGFRPAWKAMEITRWPGARAAPG
jgi:ribosomal protein S18 acetylase RimI-like enzyme